MDAARKIEGMLEPLVDAKSVEQSVYFHLLQGETALAQKDEDKAIELLTLSNKENPTGITAEALARACQQSGRTREAVTAYERFLGPPRTGRCFGSHSNVGSKHITRWPRIIPHFLFEVGPNPV